MAENPDEKEIFQSFLVDKCRSIVNKVTFAFIGKWIYFVRSLFYERQHAIARICYRPSVCPSVCLSVRRVGHRKTVEVRIMKSSLYGRVAPSL